MRQGHPNEPIPTQGATEAPETEEERRARTESLGEMFSRLSKDLSTLVRQEIQLAKAEATESAKQAGTGIGMLVGAAIGAIMLLAFLSTALMWALSSVMHLGWAALIVAAVWAIIGGILFMVGKKKLEEIKGLPRTQQTAEEIPATLNPNKETP
jgi:tetrahydromethanopterin S-methyltransferase subunit G